MATYIDWRRASIKWSQRPDAQIATGLTEVAPRTYTLRRRAASAAATRERILEAAAEEYRERGVAGTTIGAVATRADVSRGTILHHFGGAEGLLDAVLDGALAVLEVPDEQLLAGVTSPEDRARRFADAMLRFYDRTAPWWEIFGPEQGHPVVQAKEAQFWGLIGAFQRAALGPAAEDRVVQAATGALVHPVTLGTLRSLGLSLDEAIDIVGGLIVDVVRRHGPSGP